MRSQNSKSLTRSKGRIRGSVTRHFRRLEGRKRVKLLSFFSNMTSFQRVWFRPKNGTFLPKFWTCSHGRQKNPERNEENTPKRRLSEMGHESFFLRKFRFSCPSRVKKAAIPRPGNVYTWRVHGVRTCELVLS